MWIVVLPINVALYLYEITKTKISSYRRTELKTGLAKIWRGEEKQDVYGHISMIVTGMDRCLLTDGSFKGTFHICLPSSIRQLKRHLSPHVKYLV